MSSSAADNQDYDSVLQGDINLRPYGLPQMTSFILMYVQKLFACFDYL
jgi:hypothetical protein